MDVINIVSQDKSGNVIERSDINFAPVLSNLWQLKNKEEFNFLLQIAPYDDTIVNTYQIRYLLEDLNRLLKQTSDKSLGDIITNTVNFLSSAKDLTYIKFIGD